MGHLKLVDRDTLTITANDRPTGREREHKHAFSNDAPTPGKARLRPVGDDGLRRAIVAYAEGCSAAIRNPLSHDEGALPQQEALEQLAALSVLARWIDGASVLSV